MQKLINGIHHFQESIFGTQRELFERLANGQSPETLFITCSDSRIPVERVFDQGGAARRYAPPVEEGDTSYETLAWLIGVEGRRGAAARDAAPADALTKARATALGDRSNFGFSV